MESLLLAMCVDCGCCVLPFFDVDERARWVAEHEALTGGTHEIRLGMSVEGFADILDARTGLVDSVR